MTRLRNHSHLGSSPRVRGKQEEYPVCDEVPGLIPARAGKTGLVVRDPRAGQAHPRACGENAATRAPVLMSTGSSPRVRGKRALPS